MGIKLMGGAIGLALSLSTVTPAGLVAYEGFEKYTAPSDANGLNQGMGWTGAWDTELKLDTGGQPIGTAQVVSQSLSVTGIDGGSQALRLDATTGAGRAVSRQFTRQTGEMYMSFLVRAENLGGNELLNIYTSDALSNTGDSDGQIGAAMLNTAGNPFAIRVGMSWRVGATSTLTPSSQGVTSVNGDHDPAQTFLVVARFYKPNNNEYDGGQIWVYDSDDVIPETAPAAMATAHDLAAIHTGIQYVSVRTHALEAGESLTLDEFRIGTDWASVVPVPEPSGLALLALAGPLALRRRRQRH